jgi:hypothetical protein
VTILIAMRYATRGQDFHMGQAFEKEHIVKQRALTSLEDRQLILEELDAILASYHFRGSKRYPALLKFIVNAALENRSPDLKERILGVEVFGRDPGYDTNADPVVRISAGEVRKRIAQFYHENGHHSRIQIELPLGSYAPEFLQREPQAAAIPPGIQPSGLLGLEGGARITRPRSLARLFGLGAILGTAALGMGFLYHHRQSAAVSDTTVLREVWAPMLQTARPVLIVLRTAPPRRMPAVSEPISFAEHMHYVSISIAVALAHLGGVLNELGKSYEVKEAPQTTLTDISSRPVILVGAMNNQWTMRLVSRLRFHFVFFPDGKERIEDSTNPGQAEWEFNALAPYASVTSDYAIVARFHDSTTQGPVMIIAGLGAYGTEAAGEFVQSPQYLAQLSKALPPGWEGKNFELVLRTDVIGYNAGPPVLLSAYAW